MPHAAHSRMPSASDPQRAAASPSCPAPASPAPARAGFTLLEMMIVVVVIGIIAMLATPKLAHFRDQSALSAARQQMAATSDAARAAAIQRGRPAYVRRVGSRLIAAVDTSTRGKAPSYMRVMVAGPLDTLFGVKLTGALPQDTAVWWDGRGFALPRPDSTVKFVVTNKAGRDSVCISKFGIILPRRCMP